jgi:hypothetical protein
MAQPPGQPPPGAKFIEGCTDYGIDGPGNYAFFGFRVDSGPDVHFTADHYGLGNVINYLQTIAQEAQQRRLQLDPNAADLETPGKSSNPVLQIDIDLDVMGQSALWQCTMQDGTRLEAQMPLDLMENIAAALPSRIVEMKRRQAEHKRQN